jgi:hypothetical protein
MVPGEGNATTVSLNIATAVLHMLVTEYEMDTIPALIPLTTPELVPTVATAVLLLLQTPPDTVSASVTGALIHTMVAPETEPETASGLTVTTILAVSAPQLLVTL